MANKIGWCDKTINPVVGCNIRCGDWCYARRQAKRQKQNCMMCYRFIPHEHLKRLKQLTPRQKPMKVFIDSMWDWNSPGVKPEWCRQIIYKMIECPQHIFLILSKNPKGFSYYEFPENVWLGTSITNMSDEWRAEELRVVGDPELPRFLSLEPMLGYLNIDILKGIDWVIIGGLSQQGKDPLQPPIIAVECILTACEERETPVFMKDNLIWPEMKREFPKAMEHTIRKVA